jgi:hypothetical protein
VDCSGVWIVVDCSGLWIVDCGLWIVACGLWIVACGLWLVDCGLWLGVVLIPYNTVLVFRDWFFYSPLIPQLSEAEDKQRLHAKASADHAKVECFIIL